MCMFSLVTAACQGPNPTLEKSPCSALVASTSGWQPPTITTGETEITLAELSARLAENRVILIGERHNRYDHHLNQLELMCRLNTQGTQLALAVEFIQQPFQHIVDDYAQGLLDEEAFLHQSEYFKRWGFDYRLYAPLLRFANAHAIPIIALNIPGEITAKVARHGLESLSQAQRQYVPANAMGADKAYRARLKHIFAAHEETSSIEFNNFLDAQLLWDEGMAERAARYLKDNPQAQLIIIAGNGHVAHRNALAARIAARQPGSVVIIDQDYSDHSDADYALLSVELSLPPAGKLGVFLDSSEQGLRVASFTSQSAALAAGIKSGDRIDSINGRATPSFGELKLLLWRKLRGEQISIGVSRDGVEQTYDLTLQ